MKQPALWDLEPARSLLLFNKFFHEHSLRTRVVLSQLPLSVTVCVVAILVLAFFPDTYKNPFFQVFLISQAFILAMCIAVPWDRLPFPSFLAIPLLDMVSIACAREGGQESLTGLSLLVVLPVTWLCASALYPRLAIALSFFGPLAIVWAPLFIRGSFTGQDLTRPALLPIVTLGIGMTVSVMTHSMVRQQRDLEEKDRALNDTLNSSMRQERLLNTVMETLPLGVVAVDDGGHDVLMNQRQRRIHRLSSPPENPDPNESQLLVFQEDRTTPYPTERRPVRRAVLGEQFTDQIVWAGTGEDQRAYATSAQPMYDDDQNFAGSVVVFNDVTDLLTALAAKDDFVAKVSHEFRTPLTSILGYLELVLDEPGSFSPSARARLEVVQRNAERLLTLVSDLLSVRSGQMLIQPEPVNLAELIRGSVHSAAPRAALNRVSLSVSVPETLEAHLDPTRISQVLDNLLSNAIKYSPDGGEVTITAGRDQQGIVCSVKDSGMGMAPGDQERAFSMFYRAPKASDSAIPGMGLGLPISRTIVEAHGGTITLQSSLGQGTTVTVQLPA